jgi:hypothetical protein
MDGSFVSMIGVTDHVKSLAVDLSIRQKTRDVVIRGLFIISYGVSGDEGVVSQ